MKTWIVENPPPGGRSRRPGVPRRPLVLLPLYLLLMLALWWALGQLIIWGAGA